MMIPNKDAPKGDVFSDFVSVNGYTGTYGVICSMRTLTLASISRATPNDGKLVVLLWICFETQREKEF